MAFEDGCRAGEGAAFADLLGVDFQHDLQLTIRDWTVWADISERLSTAGADVRALQLSRSDGGFHVQCRVKRVSEASVRGLVDALLDDGVAVRASVEHLVLAGCAR